ncbi:class I SAM-dependent methyltransferase [Cronbergia sp. UHCC 0137]|uniref:class I SAM-dependent methyltransferase n=1 Tax=Cronbergia sp. UHCC 0137 TaxID=3110239 RepID=UPI002B21722E|nr:class I SAM-dependent methyltransferase [Cronbergia sp. UHCC 0137]MEA5616574.1 class I SAM-dependent methyltransferase [Cronbergia sp. UHCC 0137]
MKICLKCNKKFDNLYWVCPSCHHQIGKINSYLAFAPELAFTNDGFNVSAFAKLAELEAKNFWFCSRNRLIIWALKNYFTQMYQCLEIGCGTGFVLSEIEQTFPQLTLYGSEAFITGLDFARKRLSRSELFQMDARKIPFEDEFDLICAFDVLEHIKEDEIVLKSMYRATNKYGGILLTVPQHPWLWSQADAYARHVRRYSKEDLKNKVEDAGFRIVKMTSFVSLLLPLMLLSRLRQRKPTSNYDPLSEFRISGILNVVLEKILNLELMMIKSGISFSYGGSLLLVAKKM